uniref:Uncharacterized protein n=1 Tax=Heterosigma akashiwo TaxID=2829 RepID=A0A7S3UY20_HETAK|mmetsp:Transcript_29131/g.52744  ORF Transcript_29131/g.52744 Transcript_29131/m.52744 type:complete len:221 (-) Transcript_29131:514-1176(-)
MEFRKRVFILLAVVAIFAVLPTEAAKKVPAVVVAVEDGVSNIWAKMHDIYILGTICTWIDTVALYVYETFIRPMTSFNESSMLVGQFAGLLLCVVGCLTAINVAILLINAVKDYFDNYINVPFPKRKYPGKETLGKIIKWFKDLKLDFFVPVDGDKAGGLSLGGLTNQLANAITLALTMYLCSNLIQLFAWKTLADIAIEDMYKVGVLCGINALLIYTRK